MPVTHGRQVTSKWLNPVPVDEHIEDLPAPYVIGELAVKFYRAIKDENADHAETYGRLVESAGFYCDGWGTHAGFVIIQNWNLEADFDPLFDEALKALCLKAAVFEVTQSEEHAELLISSPVDEMVHTILAQTNLLQPMEDMTGVRFKHMTDLERFGYEAGGYAYQCYVATGWGIPPERYWIGTMESARRLRHLNDLYVSIGIRDFARSHEIDFSEPVPA